jgi:dCMP deaminase
VTIDLDGIWVEYEVRMAKWDKRYLELARLVSSWSKDPRKKVGAVITEDNYVRSIGFNGFPRAVDDSDERLNNQELKNKLMLHAEVNAIMAAQGKGDAIYIYPCLPCMACLMQLIQIGIERVITPKKCLERATHWDSELVLEILKEQCIQVSFIDLEER